LSRIGPLLNIEARGEPSFAELIPRSPEKSGKYSFLGKQPSGVMPKKGRQTAGPLLIQPMFEINELRQEEFIGKDNPGNTQNGPGSAGTPRVFLQGLSLRDCSHCRYQNIIIALVIFFEPTYR
jgi:hypothetical protein